MALSRGRMVEDIKVVRKSGGKGVEMGEYLGKCHGLVVVRCDGGVTSYG